MLILLQPDRASTCRGVSAISKMPYMHQALCLCIGQQCMLMWLTDTKHIPSDTYEGERIRSKHYLFNALNSIIVRHLSFSNPVDQYLIVNKQARYCLFNLYVSYFVEKS